MCTFGFEEHLSTALVLRFISTFELPGELLKIANTSSQAWGEALHQDFKKLPGDSVPQLSWGTTAVQRSK